MSVELNKIIEAEAWSLYPNMTMVRNPGDKRDAFKEGCNFMTEYLQKQFDEQRAKIAGDAFDAGAAYAFWFDNGNGTNQRPSKEEYLSSLNSKPFGGP